MVSVATGKDPAALRTIGELAAETGIPPHILRYWERVVPALKPLRRAGDRRYYRAEDSALVRRLQHLVNVEGYTLDGAARALADGSYRRVVDGAPSAALAAQPITPPVAPLGAPAHRASEGVSREILVALRDRLASALAEGGRP